MLKIFPLLLYFLTSFSPLLGDNRNITKIDVGFTQTSGLTFAGNGFSGILGEAFNCLLEDIKLFKTIEYPSPYRLWQDLSNGKLNIGLLLIETDERSEDNIYVADFIHSKLILVKNSKIPNNTVIGIRAGSAIIESALKDFLENNSNYNVVRVKSTEQLNKLLLFNRIQLALDAKALFRAEILDDNNFTIMQTTTLTVGTYISKPYYYRLGDKGLDLLKKKHTTCQSFLPLEFK
jgi:hypothetical protein